MRLRAFAPALVVLILAAGCSATTDDTTTDKAHASSTVTIQVAPSPTTDEHACDAAATSESNFPLSAGQVSQIANESFSYKGAADCFQQDRSMYTMHYLRSDDFDTVTVSFVTDDDAQYWWEFYQGIRVSHDSDVHMYTDKASSFAEYRDAKVVSTDTEIVGYVEWSVHYRKLVRISVLKVGDQTQLLHNLLAAAFDNIGAPRS